MTVTRTDMLNSFGSVSHVFIDVLNSWVQNEATNLQGFINYPEEHAEYSPYIIPDFDALQQRVSLLNQASQLLTVISLYKQGMTITDSQYESAIDSLPLELWERLSAWMEQRKLEMDGFLSSSNRNQAISPLSAYSDMFTFDEAKYTTEYEMYLESLSGIMPLIEYKIENTPLATTTVTATQPSTTDANTSGNTSGGTGSGGVTATGGPIKAI